MKNQGVTMRPNSTILTTGLTWATLMTSIMAQEAAKPSPAPTTSTSPEGETTAAKDAVKSIAETYFKNWKTGKGAESLSLFQSPQVTITGPLHSPTESYWSKSAAEYTKRFPDKPIEYLPVESIAIDMQHEGLAVVRTKYRGGGHKDSAIFTVARQSDRSWKIVALFVDSHFVW